MLTKSDKVELIPAYRPTPKQAQLLEVLLDPESQFMTVTAICEKASISRDMYYETMKKPEFSQLLSNLTRSYLESKVPVLMQHGVREALAGHQGSPQYWKALMQMAGHLKTGKEAEVAIGENEDGPMIRVRFVDPNEAD